MLPLRLQIGYESMVNFSFRSKTAFHSLPAVDPETLPISKMEFLWQLVTTLPTINYRRKGLCRVPKPTYNYQRSLLALLTFLTSFRLLFQRVLGCFFNVSDRYWIDPKHVSGRLFVLIRSKKDQPDMDIG